MTLSLSSDGNCRNKITKSYVGLIISYCYVTIETMMHIHVKWSDLLVSNRICAKFTNLSKAILRTVSWACTWYLKSQIVHFQRKDCSEWYRWVSINMLVYIPHVNICNVLKLCHKCLVTCTKPLILLFSTFTS